MDISTCILFQPIAQKYHCTIIILECILLHVWLSLAIIREVIKTMEFTSVNTKL